jgi:hypothetical protein
MTLVFIILYGELLKMKIDGKFVITRVLLTMELAFQETVALLVVYIPIGTVGMGLVLQVVIMVFLYIPETWLDLILHIQIPGLLLQLPRLRKQTHT